MARPPAGSIWPASSTRRSAWWWRRGGSPASTRCATRTSSSGWTKRPRSAAEGRPRPIRPLRGAAHPVPVRCWTTVHVYDAVVIGASQAGLSASYHLRLISGSTTYPRRGANGRSRLIPSPSQRRPAAASGGAAGWEACQREDLATSPVRRHPESRYGSRTSWLDLVRARASISWETPAPPIGSFGLVAAQQPQAATSTTLPLSPAPSVRGRRPPSPCPQPLPAPRRRPLPRCPPSLPPHRPPWLRW